MKTILVILALILNLNILLVSAQDQSKYPSVNEMAEKYQLNEKDLGIIHQLIQKKIENRLTQANSSLTSEVKDCHFELEKHETTFKGSDSIDSLANKKILNSCVKLELRNVFPLTKFPEPKSLHELPEKLKSFYKSDEAKEFIEILRSNFERQFYQNYQIPIDQGGGKPQDLLIGAKNQKYCQIAEIYLRQKYQLSKNVVTFQCTNFDLAHGEVVYSSYYRGTFRTSAGYSCYKVINLKCEFYTKKEIDTKASHSIEKNKAKITSENKTTPSSVNEKKPKSKKQNTDKTINSSIKAKSIPKTIYAYDIMNSDKLSIGSEDDKVLANKHSDTHDRAYHQQNLLEKDIAKLERLMLAEKVKKENELNAINELRKKSIEAGKGKVELSKIKLNPEKPFFKVSIDLDVTISPEDLPRLYTILNDGTYDWFVACLPQTEVIVNEKNEITSMIRSKVICLTPNFVAETIDPRTKKVSTISIPLPAIFTDNVVAGGNCGTTPELKRKLFLSIEKLKIKIPKKNSQVFERPIIEERPENRIELYGGFSLRVVDSLSLKPIANAKVKYAGKEYTSNAQGMLTDPKVSLKHNGDVSTASHPRYETNSKKVMFRLAEVTANGDLLLDPKLVDVKGSIVQNITPKFDHSLANQTITLSGYGKVYTAKTNELGEFVFLKVPVILEDFRFDNLDGSYQDTGITQGLSVEVENFVTMEVNPLLTKLNGYLHDQHGRPVKNYQFQVEYNYQGNSLIQTLKTDDRGYYLSDELPLNGNSIILKSVDPRYAPDVEEKIDVKIQALYNLNRHDLTIPYLMNIYEGKVRDVRSKSPISNVRVELLDNEGQVVKTVYTNSNGLYSADDVVNIAKIRLTHNDYITETESVPKLKKGEKLNSSFYMINKDITQNKIIAVLTWNEKQNDLDSQIFAPNGRHIFYKTLSDPTLQSSTGTRLDTDDTGINGRETTFFELPNGNTVLDGRYDFLVYQYGSKQHGMITTGARVRIYSNGDYIIAADGSRYKDIIPPQDKKYLWNVFSVVYGKVVINNRFEAEAEAFAIEQTSEKLKELDGKLIELQNSKTNGVKGIEAKITKSKNIIADVESKIKMYTDLKASIVADKAEQKALKELADQGVIETTATPEKPSIKVKERLVELNKNILENEKKLVNERNEVIKKDKSFKAYMDKLNAELAKENKLLEKLEDDKLHWEERCQIQINEVSEALSREKAILETQNQALFAKLRKFL